MTEQLYRVCWRSYNDGRHVTKHRGDIDRTIYNGTKYIRQCRAIDPHIEIFCDYWLEPV